MRSPHISTLPAQPRILACCLAVVLIGWTRPKVPAGVPHAVARADQLDYVLVSVNGHARLVRQGEELTVVRGDELEVKDAALVGRGAVKDVDVLGFQPKGGARADDRGVRFKTDELIPRWSEDETGEVFAIMAKTKKQQHAGAIFLRLIPPVLRYAEISVNGARRVLRDGEPLKADAKDLIKVEAVKTNLESEDDVVFQIVPLPELGQGAFEIRFLRAGLVFAKIPLTMLTERG